jgi:exodeoxyribonuclease VII large subunit
MARQRLTELAQHASFARLREALGRRQQRVDDLVYRLSAAQGTQFERQRRRMDVAATRLRHFDLRGRFSGMRRQLEAAVSALAAGVRTRLLERRARFDRINAHLEELSPLKILDRGYALVFDAAGNLLKDAAKVSAGDEIRARLARGTLTATVKGKA